MSAPSVTYTFSNGTAADASQVNQNFTDVINGVSDGTKDLSINALTCAGTATFNGACNFGNATSDDMTFTGYIASDFISKTAGSYALGSSDLPWKGLYLDNSTTDGGGVYFNSSTSSNIKSTADGATLNLNGFTSYIFNSASVGIGVSPSFKLDLQAAGGTNYVAHFQNTTNTSPYTFHIEEPASASSGYPLLAVTSNASSTTHFRIDSSTGNIGIGTGPSGSSGNKLKVHCSASSTSSRIAMTNAASGSTDSDGFFIDLSGSGNGNVLMKLQETGQVIDIINNSLGVRLSDGGTSWSSLSDGRKKTKIEDISGALNKLLGLTTMIFRYHDDEKTKRRPGLIAQEVQAVFPEAVSERDDTYYLSYTELIPLIISSIKDLKALIDAKG